MHDGSEAHGEALTFAVALQRRGAPKARQNSQFQTLDLVLPASFLMLLLLLPSLLRFWDLKISNRLLAIDIDLKSLIMVWE